MNAQQNKKPVKKNNYNKKKNFNKNRRPKSLTPAKILQKYDNLMEQHIIARKKYFEMHARVHGKQLDKIEQNYYKTLTDLRKFEAQLKDWQRDTLNEKIDNLPLDRDYTKNNGIEPKGEDVPFSGDFEDPHLLSTQKESDYSKDTEESIGSIEDYYKYKGIEPVKSEDANQ